MLHNRLCSRFGPFQIGGCDTVFARTRATNAESRIWVVADCDYFETSCPGLQPIWPLANVGLISFICATARTCIALWALDHIGPDSVHMDLAAFGSLDEYCNFLNRHGYKTESNS